MRLIRRVRVLRRGRWGIALRGLVGGVWLLVLVVGVGLGGVLGVRWGGVVVVGEEGDVELEVVEVEEGGAVVVVGGVE